MKIVSMGGFGSWLSCGTVAYSGCLVGSKAWARMEGLLPRCFRSRSAIGLFTFSFISPANILLLRMREFSFDYSDLTHPKACRSLPSLTYVHIHTHTQVIDPLSLPTRLRHIQLTHF